MEEIPDEPAPGYRPELARPHLGKIGDGLPTETWLDVQRDAAIALWDVRSSWEVIRARSGAVDLLTLPSGWLSTRLLCEIHGLATFVVRFTAIGAPAHPDECTAFPARLDAVSELAGLDALTLLRGRAVALYEAMCGPLVHVQVVERAAAELAWITREFARCTRYRISHEPSPPGAGRPVYADALAHVERAAAAGMNLGDPTAARLLDVVASVLADLSARRLPLQGIALPASTFSGKGKNRRSIESLAAQVEREVLPAMASHRYAEGPSGGALLHVALAMGIGAGERSEDGIPFYDALIDCRDAGEDDPRVWDVADPAEFALLLVLRALDALGFDTGAMLEGEAQAMKRGGRAKEFRALDDAGRALRVRNLLRKHKGGALGVSRYLGVPVAEVRAVMSESTVGGAKARVPSKSRRG